MKMKKVKVSFAHPMPGKVKYKLWSVTPICLECGVNLLTPFKQERHPQGSLARAGR
jgi:hypothetical protein